MLGLGLTGIKTIAAISSAVLLGSLFQRELAGAEGCPAPSFVEPQRFGAGTNPVCVAVGDFNGDGMQDLAVADDGYAVWPAPQANGAVWVLLGEGDGTLHAATRYNAGTPTRSQ